MKAIAAAASAIAILCIAAWAATPTTQPTAASGQGEAKLLVRMQHEEGWDVGKVRTFSLYDDGTFIWVRCQNQENKTAQTLVGTLPKEKVQALIDHLAAAGAGMGAKDAGTATFDYVQDGQNHKKVYTLPTHPPCSGLLAEIDQLAQSHGKAPGATSSSQPAATGPATRPVDDKAVAELIRQLADKDYKVREDATAKLKDAGLAAVELLKAKALEPNLDADVSSRVMAVLTSPMETPAVQVGGVDFQVVTPVVWVLGEGSSIPLHFKITNATDKALQFDIMDTLAIHIMDAAGKQLLIYEARKASTVPAPMLIAKGQSGVISRTGTIKRSDKGFRLAGWEDAGGIWYFDGLMPGEYTVGFTYESTQTGVDALKQSTKVPADPFWTGQAVTKGMTVLVMGKPVADAPAKP